MEVRRDVSRLWSELRRLTGLATAPAPGETSPAEEQPPVQPGAGTHVDRLRSHPHLLEVWADAPTTERIRFFAVADADADRRVVGEMPRGLSSFLINLGEVTAEPAVIEWHPLGGASASAPRRAVLVGSDPLQPRISCGTRIRLHWQTLDFPHLRIAGLRWVEDGTTARPVPLATPQTADSGSAPWIIPDEWLGPDPLELRLTPVAGDHQGLTERLILPPRRLRVETVFQRVMLPVHGRLWRRLRVEVRVPPPLVPPLAVHVDWQPYDSGVTPASFRRHWPPGATSVAVDLENISLRGDRVRVRFEPADGRGQPFAWFAADESGYGPAPPDVLLAEGLGPDCQQFEYMHIDSFPPGERANLLVGDEPLPGVPALGATSADGVDESRPTTLLAMYQNLAADPPLWAELRRLRGASDDGAGEFARAPQVYLQYAREPDLRAIALRCGLTPSPFIVGQLVHAWAEQGLPADHQVLAVHWAEADDRELDRWLGAVAAGASVARLRTFWFQQRWTDVGVRQVLECSCHLDRMRDHPLTALVPEVIPESLLAGELRRAIEQEGRLPAVAPEEFAPIVLLREMVLSALSERWARLLPSDADDRCRRIAAHLRSEPAAAARELAELRQSPGSARLNHGPWPVFEAERELAAIDLRQRHERELRLRTAADWCRMLLQRRMVPAWPWHGLLPADQDTGSLLPLWESVRAQLPEVAADSPQPPAALVEALARLDEAATEVGDADLQAVAAALRAQGAALGVWTQ
jgi:hypothetical protein